MRAAGRWTTSSRARVPRYKTRKFVERRRVRFYVQLASDVEARGEEYVAGDPYTGSLIVINVPKLHTL